MAKSANQKLKILYLLDYLERYSSENHPVTISDLQAMLEQNGIQAGRKTLYDDLETISSSGKEIVAIRKGQYYLAWRVFELAELKLLVDSVQASRFITQKKSAELIKKLEGLTSMEEAQQLHRQVLVQNRVKTMNESIYYNVDCIHGAISRDKQVCFRYFDYGMDRQQIFRRNGEEYQVSPFALLWADDNYYLVGFDRKNQELRHYRVDKMNRIREDTVSREGVQAFQDADIRRYASRVFGMFRGREKDLKLRFHRRFANAVLDRFGQDVVMIPDGAEHFTVRVSVSVSPQFYGWLCGLGSEATIAFPQAEKEAYRDYLAEILKVHQ